MSGLPSRQPRFLISRLSAHGDVVQTLPLLSDLRRQWPDAFIGWVVEASAAPLLEDHPMIDRLHVSRRKSWLSRLKNPLQWVAVIREFLVFVGELRAARYEIGLDVQGLFKSAVWLPLAGIPHRYGFERTREQAALFYNHKLPYHDLKNPDLRTVDIFRSFAQVLGVPPTETASFALPPVAPETRQKVDSLLSGLPNDRPVIALAPFTRWASKTWPETHWRELLKRLQERKVDLMVLGSPEDAPAVERMIEGTDVLNLAGKTGWTDLYALFERVDVLIGLDSAPLHIANAVGKPLIIGLFGPTGPRRTGPVGDQHLTIAAQLDCQPCFERNCPLKTTACMRELMPDQVMAAVDRQLAQLGQAVSSPKAGV